MRTLKAAALSLVLLCAPTLAEAQVFTAPGTGTGTVVSADVTRPNNTTTYTTNTAWANATSGATYTTFAGVCRANGTVVLMPVVRIIDYANQTTKLQGILWLFSVAPATPINDNAAFNLASGDLANIASVPLAFTESVVANAGSGASGFMVGSLTGATYEIKCAANDTNIYAMVEVTNAYVPVASEKLNIALKVVGAN